MNQILNTPFKWRDIFEIKEMNLDDFQSEEEYNKYLQDREVLEQVLDYEFADNDQDGIPDKENAKNIVEGIRVFNEFEEYEGKIEIDLSRGHRNGSHVGNGKDKSTPYVNLDFEQMNKLGIIDQETGLISPLSLNSVAMHEFDHLFDEGKLEDMMEFNERVAYLRDERKKNTAELNSLIESREELSDREEIAALDVKILEINQRQTKLNDRESSILDEYSSLSIKEDFYENEIESMDTEYLAGKGHGEPIRFYYFAIADLKPENRPENVIFYTSDDQQYSDQYQPTQRVTDTDVRLKYRIAIDPITNAKFSSQLFYDSPYAKGLMKLHNHLLENKLYDNSIEANQDTWNLYFENLNIQPEYNNPSFQKNNLKEVYEATDVMKGLNFETVFPDFQKDNRRGFIEIPRNLSELENILDAEIRYAGSIGNDQSGNLPKNTTDIEIEETAGRERIS